MTGKSDSRQAAAAEVDASSTPARSHPSAGRSPWDERPTEIDGGTAAGVPPAKPLRDEVPDGWPPGCGGWGGVPVGELAFELCDLVGPGDPHSPFPDGGGPPQAGAVSRHDDAGLRLSGGADSLRSDGAGSPVPGRTGPPTGPPGGDPSRAGETGSPAPAEPMLSAVLGIAMMGDEDCLALMARASRAIARWQAVMIRAQARFAELRPPTERGETGYSEFAADEIACELDVSPVSARNKLSLAHTLATRLPATVDALEAGQIDYARAAAMADVTDPLSDEQARDVENRVLARGGRSSHGAFRQAARRAALKADPDAAEKRRKAARADRQVATRDLGDGAAELNVTLPAELVQAIYTRLTLLARKAATPGDPRTMDQLRADAAAALLLGANREHLAVEVHVTVPATTLLGLAEDPGELEGFGPIPAGVARELAENATWRRIVTDPVDGTVLDVGRRRHPSAELARHVQLRDRTCRFPGCNQPARQADLDHTRRHADGGTTHDGQLAALCRHHHRLKDDEHTGWTLTQPIPGHLEWTSPIGRVYHVGPTPADHDPPHASSGLSAGSPGGGWPPAEGDPPF